MNGKAVFAGLLMVAFPVIAPASPPAGEYYGYWSEPDSRAYVSLAAQGYEISGRYVAVMTFEENPRNGTQALVGEIFDCLEMQYALVEKIEYDTDNNEISSYSNENLRKSFGPVEEDTRQEFLLIGICEEESGKPYGVATARQYFKMIAESLEVTERLLNR